MLVLFHFLLPLISDQTLCLILLHKILGNIEAIISWPGTWNYNKVEYAFNEYSLISSDY